MTYLEGDETRVLRMDVNLSDPAGNARGLRWSARVKPSCRDTISRCSVDGVVPRGIRESLDRLHVFNGDAHRASGECCALFALPAAGRHLPMAHRLVVST